MATKNWSETVTLSSRPVLRPRTEADVVRYVTEAVMRGERLKVVGSAHSWSDVAATPDDGQLLSMELMSKLLSVDCDAGVATFQGGLTIVALNALLAKHKPPMALPFNASTSEPTFVGAAATGTHSSSAHYGNMGSLIRAMRLVDGTGRVRTITREDPLMDATAVAVGMLGIVMEVTVTVVPRFKLMEETVGRDWDDVVDNAVDLARSATFVKYWWAPGMARVHVARYTRASDDEKVTWSDLRRGVDNAVQKWVMPAVFKLQDRVPSTVSMLNRVLGAALLEEKTSTGYGDTVLQTVFPAVHRECEYALDVRMTSEAMAATRRLIEENDLHVNFILEVRFVVGDDAWLSPDYGRDSVHIGAYSALDCERYFSLFAAEMLRLGGRPHWGKEFGAKFGPEELRAAYPRADDFVRVARELDPHGIFTNGFTERVFGLSRTRVASRL